MSMIRTSSVLLALLVAGPAVAQTTAPGGSSIPGPAAPAAPAPDVATARKMLLAWFAGYELVPDEARFRRLGDALGPALRSIAADAGEGLLARARAVSALVYAPSAETSAALAALLDDATAPSLLKRKAVLVLGEGGVAGLDRVVAVFEAARDDVPLREACARALRAMGDEAVAARATLVAGETAPTVLALLRGDKNVQPGRPE
jgi:hypothetical protein